jgi:hypothetical protein
VGFVASQSPVRRRALVLYPICLYYFVIAWLVLNDAPAHGLPGARTDPTLPTAPAPPV